MTKNARPLREWARFSVFNPANAALSQTLKTFTKGEFERRRKQFQSLHELLTAKHQHLNTFFGSSHLAVPSDHPMVRDWDRLMTRLKSAAKRERRQVAHRSKVLTDVPPNSQRPETGTQKVSRTAPKED